MTIQIDKPAVIEPGLLSLFRLFIGLQWLLMMLAVCSLAESPDAGARVTVIFTLLYSSLLLLYLRSQRFQRWLGRVFLPLGLLVAATMPILIRALSIQARLDDGVLGIASANEPGTLTLWLFAPMVAVAAQYGMIAVVLFCAVTSGMELYFAAELAQLGSAPVDLLFEQLVVRNLIFIAVGFIISRLIAEQRRQRTSLRVANQQLAQYAVTLEQLAVSRERNRIARDLHDTLAHTLSAVSIQLEAVTTIWDTNPQMARERIETVQSITREGLGETRRALQSLRSSPVDDVGLVMAIQMMGETAAERAGFRLHFNAPDTLPDLPMEVELNLYRIAEEALNNVVRHAQATDVWLRVDLTKKQLALHIRDNGIGFDSDASPPEGHYGLVGMAERANLCGAILKVESEPTVGTRISVILGLS